MNWTAVDPRVKLAGQGAFALAAFAHPTPVGLAALTAVVSVVVWTATTPLRELLWPYRFLLPFLLAGPVVRAVRLGPPWLTPEAAVTPALASYRTVLLVAVGAVYLHTTPVRESEAAVAWLVPGRVGRLLALGVGLVFRFLPLARREVRTTKEAMDVRLAAERPLRDRIRLLVGRSVTRLFRRADRLALALRARCLSWNPTYPRLQITRADLPVLAASCLLLGWALTPFVARVG